MDGVGNGPYGWTMGDVGGMEDMDWYGGYGGYGYGGYGFGAWGDRKKW